MQAKLNEGRLLNAFGKLIESGYSTSLIKSYRRRDIKVGSGHIKESDFYYIGNSRYAVCIQIADYSYLGFAEVMLVDYEKKEIKYKRASKLFTYGKLGMPKSSDVGDVEFRNDKVSLKFCNDGSVRNIRCKFNNFDGVADFECDIELIKSTNNSIVTAKPYENKKLFTYRQTIPALKVRGKARIGGRKLSFSEMDSIGIMKWERSATPYKTNKTSAVLSDIYNGKILSFNLCTDSSNSINTNDNMLFYDNKTYKLEHAIFDIQKNEKGKLIYTDQWNIKTNDNLLSLKFTPIVNSKVKQQLCLVSNSSNYLFGFFSGKIKFLDKSEKEIKIDNLLGFIDINNIRG